MKTPLRKNGYMFSRPNVWMATSTLSPISSKNSLVIKSPSIDKILKMYYTHYYTPELQIDYVTKTDLISSDKLPIGGVFLAGFVTGFAVAKVL